MKIKTIEPISRWELISEIYDNCTCIHDHCEGGDKCENCYDFCINYDDLVAIIKGMPNLALEAVGKDDKYRWHDLRKNPDDLPPCKGDYMCRVGARKYPERPMTYEPCDLISKNSNKWHDLNGYVMNHFVIKWREIEPFEEEE